ncbi:DUF262 domain-containing protein [Amycolatopsis sp. CA-126428]|uniref:DUF262 domain-containing protein n=1 Tax=Amycolatopsis sp. CA-126428 TaxID=2073158 RepID=UPI000CD20855|nr:DUF262 domain-containing protein [Amycolatopsis sp. CA-126428]
MSIDEAPDWDDSDGEEADAGSGVSSEDVTRAVVTDTDWTTETILSQLRRGNIQLDPRFQRRDAWTKSRKSKFIESLILGLPIPQIVLAEDKGRRGKFIVLDGKQRLLALRQFAAGSSLAVPDAEENFTGYSLSALEVRDDLRLATLKKMENDGRYVDDLNALLNETIRTVVVRQWPNEDFLNLVFLRLNTGSVKLSPQELRQALHPGEFTNFLDDFATESSSLQRALRIKKPDFRMRDVEILLRYFAFEYRIEKYTGNLKKFLDETVQEFNGHWDSLQAEIELTADRFADAIEATFSIFDDNAFFRWSKGGYEGRFNRAVFDVMVHYFGQPAIRDLAVEKATFVENAFKDLCETDIEFVESIQTTTKTPLATHRRLSRWGQKLSTALDVDIRIPTFEDNRINL